MRRIFAAVVPVVWIGGGLVQTAAVLAAFQDWMGLPLLLALAGTGVAVLLSPIGCVLAALGAYHVFHWPWWGVALIAFPPLLVIPFALLARE